MRNSLFLLRFRSNVDDSVWNAIRSLGPKWKQRGVWKIRESGAPKCVKYDKDMADRYNQKYAEAIVGGVLMILALLVGLPLLVLLYLNLKVYLITGSLPAAWQQLSHFWCLLQQFC